MDAHCAHCVTGEIHHGRPWNFTVHVVVQVQVYTVQDYKLHVCAHVCTSVSVRGVHDAFEVVFRIVQIRSVLVLVTCSVPVYIHNN